MLTRRHALQAVVGAAFTAGCRPAARVGLREGQGMDIDAIVIGSGFGGAVAALRLGEAGVRTLVLERGRRWPIRATEDTFASTDHPDGRGVWFRTTWAGHTVERYAGVRDIVEAKGMTITQGAGVGGGSLVYAAITRQPGRNEFRRSFGDAIDYGEMESVYYPRARAALNASPVPDDVLAASCGNGARQFLEQASTAGFPSRRIDLSVDWDVVRQELAGERKPSWILGEFTTNSGAKNTLDRNYLARAEATGFVEIMPLHRVTSIASMPGGAFRVAFERIDASGTILSKSSLVCGRLFLAAGSLGTTELLLRARETRTLPNLNEHVGHGWGANGDRFVASKSERRMVGGAALEHFDNPFGPVLLEDMPNVRFSVGFGGAQGVFRYNPTRDDVTLDWRSDDSGEVAATKAAKLTNELLDTRNGLPPSPASDATRTVHPLGGAVLGRACDTFGRVAGYAGLYVVDGSLLPGHCGCANPSLTIAALAERAMARIIAER
jgi:cholesterol oxidase